MANLLRFMNDQSYMKEILFLFILLLQINTVFSQTIKVETVLEDRYDCILGKVDDLYFDENGNFFYLDEQEETSFYITKTDTFKLPERKGSTMGVYGKYGSISTYYTSIDSFFYKNAKSTEYYSGGFGEIINQITDFNRNNVAISTRKNAYVYHFMNGRFLNKEDVIDYSTTDKWCSFSKNGNVLYYIKKCDKYYLNKNNATINRSTNKYLGLKINNSGDVLYGRLNYIKSNNNFVVEYQPKFNNKVYNSVSTIWGSYLNNAGGFYFKGGNPFYILINGDYYENVEPQNIIVRDSIHYFFYDKKKQKYIYYTDKTSRNLGRKKIIMPTMDEKGNYAMFLSRGKKTKLLINGDLQKEKVIGEPIAINPNGIFYTFKERRKRSAIYKNNEVLLNGFGKVKVSTQDQFFNEYLNNKPDINKNFTYLEIGDSGYIIWNSQISKAIHKAMPSRGGYEYPVSGEVLYGDLNENGYYFFQYAGMKKTILVMNNKIYEIEDEISSLVEDSIFFNKGRIVFYAIVKNKVKRFEVVK